MRSGKTKRSISAILVLVLLLSALLPVTAYAADEQTSWDVEQDYEEALAPGQEDIWAGAEEELPEKPFDKDDFVNRVKDLIGKQHHVIVAVSEGIKDAEGKYISAQGGKIDQFGHVMLSGTGEVLKQIVLNEIGCKCRSVELNVLQRAAAHLASETDIDESICLGKNGVKLAMEGKSGVMSTIIRDCDEPYKVHYDGADISMIANKEKTVPVEWISEDGTDVNDKMEMYLRPLIQGEKKVNYVNGIPEYIMMH